MNKNKDIYILGIESSCDDTGIAIVKNGREIVSNVVASQIDIHKLYGGVVPEIASRNHVMNIDGALDEALQRANLTLDQIDAIAVTYGAGLLGALIVGVNFAKALAYATGKPLIAVNHIEGHICANYIEFKELEPPFICLIVSGGHTALVEQTDFVTRKLIGTTTDDAIGEAFDKVARECGLEYPGGPNIQKQAAMGSACIKFITKPHDKSGYNFSYSGLKTAVINYLHNMDQRGQAVSIPDVCASFQKEAVDQVVQKTVAACKAYGYNKIVLAGGVSANAALRESMKTEAAKIGAEVYCPRIGLCTDNAAMIASRGYFDYINGKNIADPLMLEAKSTLPLDGNN